MARGWMIGIPLALGLVLTLPGCGGEEGSTSDNGSIEKSSDDSSNGSSDSTLPVPLVDDTTSTTPSEGGGSTDSGIAASNLDLSSLPDFTFGGGTGDVGFVSDEEVHTVTVDSPSVGRLSPNGRYLSVTTRADAVRGSRLAIIDMKTGEEEQSFDVDASAIPVTLWSPDSTAVLGQLATATSTGSSADVVVYRLDGSTAEAAPNERAMSVTEANPRWVIGPDGPEWGAECVLEGYADGVCLQTQLVTSKQQPVILLNDGVTFGRWDAKKKSIVKLTDNANTNVDECGRYGVLSSLSKKWVYDADTEKLTPVDKFVIECNEMVPSPSGTKLAFKTRTVPIVVDLTSGKVTEIAREGSPVAWSKDGKTVLVKAGTGSFLVAADGAGGKETSVPLVDICPGGALGKVAASTSDDVVIYDIGADSATTVDIPALVTGQDCTTTADGLWSYNHGALFDLENGDAAMLKITSEGTPEGFRAGFAWSVPAFTRVPRR